MTGQYNRFLASWDPVRGNLPPGSAESRKKPLSFHSLSASTVPRTGKGMTLFRTRAWLESIFFFESRYTRTRLCFQIIPENPSVAQRFVDEISSYNLLSELQTLSLESGLVSPTVRVESEHYWVESEEQTYEHFESTETTRDGSLYPADFPVVSWQHVQMSTRDVRIQWWFAREGACALPKGQDRFVLFTRLCLTIRVRVRCDCMSWRKSYFRVTIGVTPIAKALSRNLVTLEVNHWINRLSPIHLPKLQKGNLFHKRFSPVTRNRIFPTASLARVGHISVGKPFWKIDMKMEQRRTLALSSCLSINVVVK